MPPDSHVLSTLNVAAHAWPPVGVTYIVFVSFWITSLNSLEVLYKDRRGSGFVNSGEAVIMPSFIATSMA